MQRLLSLAAVALLAGVVAVAVVDRREETPVSAPQGATAAGGGWYDALAAPRPPGDDAERTGCGLILTSRSLGVSHPVLPCGGAPIARASRRKPNLARCSSGPSASRSKTFAWIAGSWIRNEPPPSSFPLTIRS